MDINIIPIKQATELVEKTLGKSYDIVSFLIPSIPSKIAERRVQNMIKILQKTKAKLINASLSPEEYNTIALKVGIPLIEGASMEEDPTLQEMWSNLLATALTPDAKATISPLFIHILKSLSPDDAKVLHSFYLSECYGEPALKYHQCEQQLVYTPTGYAIISASSVNTAIAVLSSFNLLSNVVESNTLSIQGNSPLSIGTNHLTELGYLFINVCSHDMLHK